MTAASSRDRPSPPRSSGVYRPQKPSSPAWAMTSVGKIDSASHSAACGAMAEAANSRAASRMACWVSSSSKSTTATLFLHVNGEIHVFDHVFLRPAHHHGLGFGVEAHRLLAVGVQVAEERVLAAGERKVWRRHRRRHVDADLADLGFVLVLARRGAGTGEDR